MKSPTEVLDVERPRFIRTRFGSALLRGENERPSSRKVKAHASRSIPDRGVIPAIAGSIFSKGSWKGSLQRRARVLPKARRTGLTALGSIPHTRPMLQPGIDPLIGRDAPLRELLALLSTHRLVTLTGPGGMGKTRLAEAAVEASRGDREAVMLDLSTVTSGDGLALALVSSLQIPAEDNVEAALHAWARSGPRLVALDNLEQVRDAAAPISRLSPRRQTFGSSRRAARPSESRASTSSRSGR